MWKASQKVICISKYFQIVPHPKPMEGSEKFPISLHMCEMKSSHTRRDVCRRKRWWNMSLFRPARMSPPAPGLCNRSHGTTSSAQSAKWPWYPIHNICSTALEYHTVTNRVCLVIKGWLYGACSQSIVFLNCLSLRRRLHNERVSLGHELETDFVLLGKVMFTSLSLGVPDGCRRAKGWGGRSPQHSSKWP